MEGSMRLITIVLSCLLAAPPLYAASHHRVLSWDAGSVTVEITSGPPEIVPIEGQGIERLVRVSLPGFASASPGEGEPVLPVRRFLFEVPSASGVRLDILDEELDRIEGALPELLLPGAGFDEQRRRLLESDTTSPKAFVRFDSVERFRGAFILPVEVTPILFDPRSRGLVHARRIVLRISFPPVRGDAFRRPDPGMGEHIIVNSDQAAGWDAPGPERSMLQRTPFEFALSDDWIKIRVNEKGIYLITYNDLLTAGIDPGGIDPMTLRLFSAPPFVQPDSIDGGGSFEEDYHLSEHAILYSGAGAGEFMPGDSLIFYCLGVDAWADDIDPAGSHREYIEHPYERENVYWLTWGGSFTGEPRRMPTRPVAASPPYDIEVISYEARMHIEQDLLYDAVHTDDRWYWRAVNPTVTTSFSNTFVLDSPVGSTGTVRTQAYGPRYIEIEYSWKNNNNSATYYVNGASIGTLNWSVAYDYQPSTMPVLEADVSNLTAGDNTFLAYKATGGDLYILWYEVFYERQLRAVSGSLDFYAPEATGSAHFVVHNIPPGPVYLFDVTHHESPSLLDAHQMAADRLEFEDLLDGSARQYMAASASVMKRAQLQQENVLSLRDDPVCPDMVIIYHERFARAAAALKSFREQGMPYAPDPYVKTVTITDVYENFSNGLKDPLAVRNYLKFLYDNFREGGEPILKYVLLIGNGTYDTKNILGRSNDYIPLYMNRFYIQENEGVEDDDFLVKLDGGDDGFADIAIGRLTVLSERDADNWVERITSYSRGSTPGPWRNRIILVADDEISTNSDIDYYFMNDAEDLADRDTGQFPRFVDFSKIYLYHYPRISGSKPGARQALIDSWNKGALVVNYSGHGSPYQMADEKVFQDSDVPSLTNSNRRPLILSFSCSTGDLADPYRRSLAQSVCTYDGGGAIASMCAASPTYGVPNRILNIEIFRALFTSRDSTATEPIGYALILGKMNAAIIRNNAKYVLLGDPAMELQFPDYTLEHDLAGLDTLKTGYRYRVNGSVRIDGEVATTFNGTADVIVQEDLERVDKWDLKYLNSNPIYFPVVYSLPGNELYRGTADVAQGRFGFDFFVPLSCRTGPDARIRSYVSSASSDAIGACDTITIAPSDSVPDNEGPPDIHLYFANQATRVKPGARLVAEISDSDGIAILGSDPQNSIYIEFDDNGFPIFVTDNFRYDHGSSVSGLVEYQLQSGFDPGPHTVILKAYDNLGAFSTDTLEFEVVEEGVYTISDAFNFPNPLREGTNFVFQLSNAGDVHLAIYNVSGVKIWEVDTFGEEGFNNIYWDGRDFAGDRPANGTYLYFLEVEFMDAFHRTETVTGKAVILR
jgi:hypothetical protein